MTEFNYIVKSRVDVPDYITVRGKEIKAYVDDDYLEDEYYPSVEYADEVEDIYDWMITLIADMRGEFLIRLTFNGDTVAEDNFYPEDTPVQQMIDRFVETLEEYLR